MAGLLLCSHPDASCLLASDYLRVSREEVVSFPSTHVGPHETLLHSSFLVIRCKGYRGICGKISRLNRSHRDGWESKRFNKQVIDFLL